MFQCTIACNMLYYQCNPIGWADGKPPYPHSRSSHFLGSVVNLEPASTSEEATLLTKSSSSSNHSGSSTSAFVASQSAEASTPEEATLLTKSSSSNHSGSSTSAFVASQSAEAATFLAKSSSHTTSSFEASLSPETIASEEATLLTKSSSSSSSNSSFVASLSSQTSSLLAESSSSSASLSSESSSPEAANLLTESSTSSNHSGSSNSFSPETSTSEAAALLTSYNVSNPSGSVAPEVASSISDNTFTPSPSDFSSYPQSMVGSTYKVEVEPNHYSTSSSLSEPEEIYLPRCDDDFENPSTPSSGHPPSVRSGLQAKGVPSHILSNPPGNSTLSQAAGQEAVGIYRPANNRATISNAKHLALIATIISLLSLA
ncbi:hypothetical protein DSO57_1002410 [Entomophthora muscae]|uniref:Uncharacterized protein n=1 Tax=Entomophthora muscae TaxID=34485 RepID=A0ACC2SAW7_9FUNG|nr:hypothetical protein DSO57_1002410 [Entomophthora muscae]